MLYLIHGEDDFLSFEKLAKNKESFVQKYGEINISVYNEENKDFNQLLNDIRSLPFLGEKRLIVIENSLSKWNKDDKKRFIDAVPEIPEKNVVIFFENQKLKDSDPILKTISPQNILYAPQLFGFEINKWVTKKLNDLGYKIESHALSTLASLVGNNTRQLDKELKKLMSLKHKEKEITEEDVKLLVKAQLDTNIFNLTDALAKKDLKTSQRIVKNIADSGENLQSILSMIAFQFRNLLLIKIGEDEKVPREILTKKTGMHPFVFQKSSPQAKNFSFEKLKEIYHLIFKTDLAIKTGAMEDALALDLLITKICM